MLPDCLAPPDIPWNWDKTLLSAAFLGMWIKSGLAREAFHLGQQSCPGHPGSDLNRLSSLPTNSASRRHQGFVFLSRALAAAWPVVGAVLINAGIHLPPVRSVFKHVYFGSNGKASSLTPSLTGRGRTHQGGARAESGAFGQIQEKFQLCPLTHLLFCRIIWIFAAKILFTYHHSGATPQLNPIRYENTYCIWKKDINVHIHVCHWIQSTILTANMARTTYSYPWACVAH